MTTKRYELLQKWPDAEIGDVYQWNGQGYSNQTRTAMVISKKYVEEYSDFFREVVEKDWEIVMCDHEHGLPHEYIDGKNGGQECLGYGCKIHSVKRLSDQEIFSVGDEIVYGYCSMDAKNVGSRIVPIKSFEIRKNEMWVIFENISFPITHIHKAKKLPTPTKPFEWNDTLVAEFARQYAFKELGYDRKLADIEFFKASKQNTNEEIKFEFPKMRREDVVCPPQEIKVNYMEDKNEYESPPPDKQRIDEKKYTLEDLEKAFDQSRKTHPFVGFKYRDFEDYKKTLEK